MLLVAAVVAMVWANIALARRVLSPCGHGAWTWPGIDEDLQHWVNDGLMALFFFVVGLEIKRELVDGELSDRRAATLPALAATAGALVPAAIFAAARRRRRGRRRDGRSRWPPTSRSRSASWPCSATACPPASSCSCWRSPIVDDIIAIAVIAVFYSDHIQLGWLAAALAAVALDRRPAPGRRHADRRLRARRACPCGSRRSSPASTRPSPASCSGC